MGVVGGGWRDDRISLADDFFLIAFDERTGRSRLHPLALNLGLAGALAGELVLSGHIGLSGGRFTVADGVAPPADAVHQRMCRHLRAEPEHLVAVWLSFFARTATDDVAERLIRHGLVRAELRGLVRSRPRYVATDTVAQAWRTFRLAQAIHRHEVRSRSDVMLLGLAAATGLDEMVLVTGGPADRDSLRATASRVRDDPAPHAVVEAVTALLATGVLAPHR